MAGWLSLAVAPIAACSPFALGDAVVSTITNGIRNTTAGARIDAHGGTILRANDGYFYWYGESYACGFVWTDPSSPYCGANVYRSIDLVHWDGPWRLFDASTGYWQDLCMHLPAAPGGGCFRPKVVYNKLTHLYVLWINTPELGEDAYRVLTSPRPTGPFTLFQEPELGDDGIPDWRGSTRTSDGDEGLYVDRNNTAWLVWNRGGRLLQEELNATFTDGTGTPTVIRNYPEIQPYAGVESPSEFEHAGRYYLSMSLPRCPYCSGTNTAIESAPSPGGPWTYQGLVAATSCSGQPNEVDQVAPGALLWTSDQWIRGGVAGNPPRLNETLANQMWEPLKFDGRRVAPIDCSPTFRIPI